MTYKVIYRVTETNVDGCGGDATEFVRFDRALSIKEQDAFQAALVHAKKVASEQDYDTSDIIMMALEGFRDETGIDGILDEAPYEGAFEF